MSASTHWLANAAAQSVLERGGNAVDAAVAAGFVLHVVEPHLNGPGGDLVAILATGSAPLVVVGQGPAPRAATIEHFLSEGLDRVPGAGALAAAVPAAVDAWFWMLAEHGTWELPEVLEYAISYAEKGHEAGPQLCRVIATMAEHFTAHWPSSAETWMPGGKAPSPGDTVSNPAYAATLRRLAEAGSANARGTRGQRIEGATKVWHSMFATDDVRSAILAPHRHSTGSDHAGVLVPADLDELKVATEEPVTLDFRGVTVAKPGFWSQGPVLLQTLSILDHVGDERLDPSTPIGAHTIIEALKLAMADRDAYYGDAGTSREVLEQLLAPEYGERRAAQIGETASVEFRPGKISGLDPYLPPLRLEESVVPVAGVGEPTVRGSGETRGDTCHLDVVDRWGNLVSVTPSGGWLQSSPTLPGLGLSLGTRLQMTWLDAESPSALVPGRRPRTTLSPTMLLDGGRPVASLGTPGGDQQDQWQLLYLLRLLVGGYTPQQAIDAPMFHTTALAGSFWPRTWTPAGVVVEGRLGAAVVSDLERRGHRVTVSADWSLGRLSTVTRQADGSMLGAAANSRGAQGYAAGR